LTRPEFEKLVTDYGNAAFDCGQWNHDRPLPVEEAVKPFEACYARNESTKAALLAAFDAFIGDKTE